MKHYSGAASASFWARVRAVHEQADTLYLLACTLQDLEGRVLQLLEQAEQKSARWPMITASS